jgi:hypothetical protein
MELGFMVADGIAWPVEGQLHDIQIAARILNKAVGPRELIGLKELQVDVLKRDLSSKSELDKWLVSYRYKPGRDIWRAPVALAGWYAQDDARDTLEIFLKWKPLVYQTPTKWWWNRAPDKTHRFDLYEMEIEAGIRAIQACMRGTRIDLALARRRANAAELLQDVATKWIRAKMDVPTLNPGSQLQLRGLLFGAFGFKLSMAHLTDAFKELSDKEQALVLIGKGEKPLLDYASLDIEALSFYADTYPEHRALLFMLSVYRKCQTAITWFSKNVNEFGVIPSPDPWWGEDYKLLYLIFHRLKTVGTRSGRMASADYNGQQVPKRFKMLIAYEYLVELIADFLPKPQLDQLLQEFDLAAVKKGDEAKSLHLEPGDLVIDMSVRRMLIARPDHNMRLWDLSQVEMRGFAHFSGNQLLCSGYGKAESDQQVSNTLSRIQAFASGERVTLTADDFSPLYHSDEGFDIHAFVASQLGIPRKSAKGINFGIVYGMGKKKLARNLGWSLEEGKRYLDNYYSSFPEIQIIQDKIKAVLRERGYIFDPFGRRYYLPMNLSYVGLNRLIQGWAASIFKTGFVRVCDLFSSPGLECGAVDPITRRPEMNGARVLTCIHDELMAELRREIDTIPVDWAVRSCMTSFYGLKVPLGTSSERSIRSWDEAEEVTNNQVEAEHGR